MSVSKARVVDISELRNKVIVFLDTEGYRGISKPISYTKFCELFSMKFPEHKVDSDLLWDELDYLFKARVISYTQGSELEVNNKEFFLN